MCPSSLSDFVDGARHKIYLAEHAKEYPFPIDGSEWSRLVSTRISHEHHVNYEAHLVSDFWVWLHAAQGPIRHERKTFKRALHHWFLVGSEDYGMPWWYHQGDDTKQELAWQALYEFARHKGKKGLETFESEWMKGGIATKVWLPKGSEHWISIDSEAWENRQGPRIVHSQEDEDTVSIMSQPKGGPVPMITAEDLEPLAEPANGVIYLPDRSKDEKALAETDQEDGRLAMAGASTD